MRNAYCNLTEFLQWITPTDTSPDVVDDSVIAFILDAVSRYIDNETRREFYPRIETRSYSIPNGRQLLLDKDLLELTTLTNGDDNEITSTYYNLIPKNSTPHYAVKLKSPMSVTWEYDSNADDEYVIDVTGVWGYRNDYSTAWVAVTTLAEDLDDSELGIDVTSAYHLSIGTIWKIDSEIFISNSISTNTVTVLKRGDNGSTATTHTTGATVYVWRPQEDIVIACKLITQSVHRRFGKQSGAESENVILASGAVVTPLDVPRAAAKILENYKPLVNWRT
jgi:hypothetical protein